MSQWGQAQPGYQYPAQTGFQGANPQFQQQNPQFQQQNPQFQQQGPQFQQGGFGAAGLIPQPTGFPGQRMQGFQQPQQAGFQGPGFLQTQPTGFPGQGGGFQPQTRLAPPPPPVPPLPTQFQQQNQGIGFLQPQQQQPQINRFLSASPGLSGPGLAPQATGFPGRAPLAPQMTGFIDPRLQMMSSTFMPMSNSSFGAGSVPQIAPPQFNLQQSFQQQQTTAPQMSWALTKAEKKQYNDIFRSWDAQSTGFISGQTALEVFGASGLPKDDLARIWTLADIDDRGKLNVAEFHVAMGLIYRRLSGMPVPDQLPPELVPPSARDLDNSVDLVKDILKHERARSPNTSDGPRSMLKNRSFNSSSSALDSGRDATIYKHNDVEPPGGFYQPRSRHINRDDVRSRNDEDSPAADLSEMKRMLANTASMLERNAEADASRTAEDEALDREMEDLKYRVKRVSDDLDYVSRGPRTATKDQEKRKLERDLLALMHERIPEVERKIKAREERRERDKREWARDRDRANERFGRYDPKDDSSSRYDDRDRDRPYSRGGYNGVGDRDIRDQDRGSYRNERSRSRDRRDYDHSRSSPVSRAVPTPPPPSSARGPLSAPPPPKATPSPAPTKNMTPEERQAYTRAQAKRRIEERMAALGVTAPSSSPTIDTSVEDRLQQEKKEAEEKTKLAEKQAEERERTRKERLEGEKAAKEAKSPALPGASPTPTPTPTVKAAAPVPTPSSKPAPPAPKRAPAPPPPRKPVVRPPIVATTPAPKPVPIPAPEPEPEVDPEEDMLRAREEAIRKQREARAEKLRQLEREEAEAARKEEEEYQARIQALKSKPTPAPVSVPRTPAFTPAPPPPKAPTPPPVAPPPPATVTPVADASKSTNPFTRFMQDKASTTPVAPPANGNTNPWTPSQKAAPSTLPNPPRSPAPTGKTAYNTAPSAIEDDWDDIKENVSDDSSDDELSGRDARKNLAMHIFGSGGGGTPVSRPRSAAAGVAAEAISSPSSPAPPPPPPPPPPSALPAVSSPVSSAPPPPPAALAAPVPVPAASPGDLSGLMASIQGGLKLRPAKTIDKSAPPVSGRVLGDAAPPLHINAAPRPASPPQPATPPQTQTNLPIPREMSHDEGSSRSSNRQSVGWFADRAADAGAEVQRLPSTNEEDEDEEDIYGQPLTTPIPAIHVNEASADEPISDIMSDIDTETEYRTRTLYPYEGEGADDLSFGENFILMANPSKSGGDWWYGTLVSNGRSGVFPKAYAEVVKPVKAKAVYAYAGGNADELPFSEGDELSIIDTSEDEWWKTEQGGVVFIVPAAYLEIVEATHNILIPNGPNTPDKATVTSPIEVSLDTDFSDNPRISKSDGVRHDNNDDDDDSDTDSSDYLSFDESDIEDSYPDTKAEREARAHERQLVLQAAGLIVTQDDKPPAGVIRARSTRRRPAPDAPPRKLTISVPTMKELPPVPEPEPEAEPEPELEPADHARRLDDAFDRYESFKTSQGNRISMASVDTTSSSPTISSFSGPGMGTSKDGESKSYSHFLNFLGRTKTPDGERRTTLNISAPIIANPEDPSRSNSPAFGTSWASLVDKTALDGIPSGERRRQEAIFELITTEAAYVRDLQLIVEVFYSTMLPLLSRKEVTVIFANIEDILLTNTALLSSLEERQKDCRLYVDRIGDILLDHLPNMGVYMEYCVNQSTAIKVLKSLRESNPPLAAHLQRLRDSDPAVRNLDLSSYLLVPMQRITKYPLLIKQILQYTEAEAEKGSINTALNISERLLDQINETIRDQEGRETLRTISRNLWIGQGRLDLTAPTRHMGPRKLIKEGPLVKAKSGRKLYGFLCSDILVLTDESMKTLYRMPIPLAQARVKEAHPGKDDHTFQVIQAYPRGGDSIALKAPSARDCQFWMQEIEYAGRRCRHAEDRAVRKHRK